MSMGDAQDESEEEEEEEEYDSPRRGEQLELGADSYADDDLYKGSNQALQYNKVDPYRLEDNREAWHPALEADIASAATVLAEKMVAHPEDGGQGIAERDEDLTQFADPLGLGVLNQATMQLEAPEDAGVGTNMRRQLQKLARHQAGATLQLQDNGDGVAVRCRPCHSVLLLCPPIAPCHVHINLH